jgi:hypothetical protein
MTQDHRIGRAWLLLSLAFGLHALEEATTGFLPIYNQTVLELRNRIPCLPIRPLPQRSWLRRLKSGIGVLLVVSPNVFQGARWTRPAAYALSYIMIPNAALHIAGTLRGRTVSSVHFRRPMPGFYTSPLLLVGALNLLGALRDEPEGRHS